MKRLTFDAKRGWLPMDADLAAFVAIAGLIASAQGVVKLASIDHVIVSFAAAIALVALFVWMRRLDFWRPIASVAISCAILTPSAAMLPFRWSIALSIILFLIAHVAYVILRSDRVERWFFLALTASLLCGLPMTFIGR